MNRSTLGAALAAAAILVTATPPASAASLLTDAFLTNVNQDVDFLDRASRFALQNSLNTKVKSFAHAQAREQTMAANTIGDWIVADLRTNHVQAGGVATGRSVALDGSENTLGNRVAELNPSSIDQNLDNLEGLTSPLTRRLASFGDPIVQANFDNLSRFGTSVVPTVGKESLAKLDGLTDQPGNKVISTSPIGRAKPDNGRSAALARKVAEMSPPAGQEELDSLEGLTGKEFDDLYKTNERAALTQLRDLYAIYAASGDDHALVTLAKAQLPKIKAQLAELGRI